MSDNEIQQSSETVPAAEEVIAPPAVEPDPRNAEAAKHRHRAKELAGHLAASHAVADMLAGAAETFMAQRDNAYRQLVEQHVAGTLIEPSDFWRDDDTVPLTEDGQVDFDAVDARASEIVKDHRHLGVMRGTPAWAGPSSPFVAVPCEGPPEPTWQKQLQDKANKKS